MPRTFSTTVIALLLGSGFCCAAEFEPPGSDDGPFNTEFLSGMTGSVDLNAFLKSSQVIPGDYRVDILVNQSLVGRRMVRFAVAQPSGKVQPCLTLEMLDAMAVDLNKLAASPGFDRQDLTACRNLPELVNNSSLTFDVNRLQLLAVVPQASLQRGVRGYVDPQLWDEGVTAGFINYDAMARRTRTRQQGSHSFYNLGLRTGLNVGAWRLRNESALTRDNRTGSQFNSNRSFAQRDVTAWKSQFTLGETYSDAQTFDSVRFRGLQLATDEGMLPDSQRGYAPVVRGIAYSNATVEIRQNGYLLQSVQVAPGPFEIADVFSSGSNGDLHIVVIEADGSRRESVQAFAALPQMVREGMFRYSLAAGQYSDYGRNGQQPLLAIATLAYGASSNTTVFGGLQGAAGFQAANLGMSWNLPFGALSADLTQSRSLATAQHNAGRSLGLRYSRRFTDTATTFSLASYRYSTSGYRTLNEHVQDFSHDSQSLARGRARSRFDMTLDQALGSRAGHVYLSANYKNYFNFNQASQQYRFGYSNTWKQLNYNLDLAHTRQQNVRQAQSNEVNLSVSLPLGSGARPSRLHLSASQKSAQGSAARVRLSGNVADLEYASYTLETGVEQGRPGSSSVDISATTSTARVRAGHSQGNGYSSLNLGASGSVVAHAGGINFGQSVSESFALLEVQGVPTANLSGNRNVTLGRNGFAVVPGTHPYRSNWLSLDTRELGAHVEIENPTRQLIPRRGSVTQATFTASRGRRVQFALSDANGRSLPFGALVAGLDGQPSAIVDPAGLALMMVTEGADTLSVQQGGQQLLCRYQLPAPSDGLRYEQLAVSCHPLPATVDRPTEDVL